MKKLFTFSLLTLSALYADNTHDVRAVIQSVDRTILSSQIAGKVVNIYKNNGDSFKKNETLIRIDCDIFKAEREKIRNKMKLAKLKYEKNKQLVKYNSVGKFEIETSKIEYDESKVEYRIASINVNRCSIKAPFTGRVVEKKVNRFQTVKPQQELIEIVNSNNLEAKLVVPATWLRWLKKDQKFNIQIDEVGLSVEAKIIQLDSVVDPKSQTVNIRAMIEKNESLIAGMSGTAKFINPDINSNFGEKNEEDN